MVTPKKHVLPTFKGKFIPKPRLRYRQEMAQNREKYLQAYENQRHNPVHTPKLEEQYIGEHVNIPDFNALYPQVALTDPPYSITKLNWDYQDTDSIMVSEKRFAKLSKKDQQLVKTMMRRFDRFKKRLYLKNTWQFSWGEAMRKWLHGLGALHVRIDYRTKEISLDANFFFHNQNIQLNVYYEPTLIQNSDGQISCYRFRLRSRDDTMNFALQFVDIIKMEYYLNVLTGLYSNDKKIPIAGNFLILLGETHPEDAK